jgi:hypothetical protein
LLHCLLLHAHALYALRRHRSCHLLLRLRLCRRYSLLLCCHLLHGTWLHLLLHARLHNSSTHRTCSIHGCSSSSLLLLQLLLHLLLHLLLCRSLGLLLCSLGLRLLRGCLLCRSGRCCGLLRCCLLCCSLLLCELLLTLHLLLLPLRCLLGLNT